MSFAKLIKSYKGWIVLVTSLGFISSIAALYVPKLAANTIDAGDLSPWSGNMTILAIVIIIALAVAWLQVYLSAYFAEKIGYDLRRNLVTKVSKQSFQYIADSTPGKLQTVFTSDVEAVKGIISSGLVTLLSALITLIGSIILLLTLNARLGLYVLSVVPFLLLSFFFIFGGLSKLFQAAQENLEKVNALISETIVGSALVRVVNSASAEIAKFFKVNTQSRDIGIGIVRGFSTLIPIVTLLSNVMTLIIVWFGGHQVAAETMTLGEFSAFLAYSNMFIWPIFMIGFLGPMISRGFISLRRIAEIADSPVIEEAGIEVDHLKGDIEFKNVSLTYKTAAGEEKSVLKDISFVINAKTKTAIVGPTAAGKTQIFYLMAGLAQPTAGDILIDNRPIHDYKISSLLQHIGLVFQDSILFNTTFRDNIAFTDNADESILHKALETAELGTLVKELPKGLNTMVSERGTSLSGGQKQRLMLARALAVQPQVLLLDDFTARVDQATESLILENVAKNYPGVTLISITQKIEPIKAYDKIIVLMEGELIASGTHNELVESSFEYNQIYQSQMSTETLHK
ncbi:MAG: hypothetical protein RJB39_444 [Candidatus Parcubacteria bacterium]|jgi:ATP-binding cassette subfamily B protein